MKMKLILTAAAALATLAFASVANAQTAAITNLSGGSNFPAFNGTNQTIGWSFTANQDITVTSLGFYDVTPADPLAQSHQVGLWNSTGTLLTSVTVSPTDPITDKFRYATVSSVALTSGSTYIVGAAITSPFLDVYNVPASITVDPAITFGESARNGSSQGFSFPSTLTAGNGRFGPNFLFTPTNSAVPEPGSVALLVGAGLSGAGFLARRKRASKAAWKPLYAKIVR